MNKRLIIGLMAFALAGALSIPAIGAGATSTSPEVIEEEVSSTVQIGHAEASAEDIAKFQIASNFRTVSEAKIKKAKQAGKCKTISGAKAIQLGVKTQGYMGSGTGYAWENRTTTMCDTNNDGKFDVRAQCGNKLIVTRQPQPAKARATIWVNSLGKATAKIKAVAKVKATARCDTGNTSATAFATATARVTLKVKLKNMIKADGRVDGGGAIKLSTNAITRAQAKAKAKAFAEVSVRCEENIPPEEEDVCPNIPGVQEEVPDGLIIDEDGNCVEPPEEEDVCPNIPGVQEEVPDGLIIDEDGNCVEPPEEEDVCPNIEGIQTEVPDGLIIDENGNCVAPPCDEDECPKVDVCPNIPGDQEEVPEGLVVDENGDCVTPEKPERPRPQPPVKTTTTVVEAGKGAPAVLPDTGPGAVVSTFVGVSSFASLAFSAITRRLGFYQ